ncbi:MAG: ribosome-binding factor A [Patescibacteria group bacterium]
MRPYRNLKISDLVQKELSKLLIRELDFEGAFVTITSVHVAEDLLQAVVILGIIPHERGPMVFAKLEEKRRLLQHLLLKKMNIRPMPTLRFQIQEPESVK